MRIHRQSPHRESLWVGSIFDPVPQRVPFRSVPPGNPVRRQATGRSEGSPCVNMTVRCNRHCKNGVVDAVTRVVSEEGPLAPVPLGDSVRGLTGDGGETAARIDVVSANGYGADRWIVGMAQ